MVNLYINSQLINLFPDTEDQIACDFSAADINKIEDTTANRSAGKSYTIKIPDDKQNNKALGFAGLTGSVGGLDQSTKITARIEQDGVDIISGYVKLISAFNGLRAGAGYYEVVIIGDNGDWRRDIAGLYLDDLDFSAFNHVYNSTNIAASETTGTFYIYGLLSYGKFTGAAMGNNQLSVLVEDRRPLVNMELIFKKIFNDAGWKLSSSFLDSAWFGKLYHTLLNEDFVNDANYNQINWFRAGMTADQNVHINAGSTSTDIINYDEATAVSFFNTLTSAFNTGTYKFVCDNGGFYKFSASYHITSTISIPGGYTGMGNIIFKIQIYHNIQGLIAEKIHNLGYAASYDISGLVETAYFKLKNGENVYVIYEITNNLSYTDNIVVVPIAVDCVLESDTASFFNDLKLDLIEDGMVKFANLLSDTITQLQYVQAVKTLFNLYFLTDVVNRTVYIEPRDDFYNDTIVDWTAKVDRRGGRMIQFIEDISKKNKYQYADDGNDALVEKLSETETYGSHTQTNSNIFAEGESVIECGLFSATAMLEAPEIGIPQDLIPALWNNVDDYPTAPDLSFDFNMRLFYWHGVKNLTSGLWFFEGTGRSDYPYFYFIDEQLTDNYGLSFGDLNKSNGLFERYYRNLHRVIDDGRLVTFTLRLSALDINTLDFRKLIQIGDDYYRINAIRNYTPSKGGLCTVELITEVHNDAIAVPPHFTSPNKLPYGKKWTPTGGMTGEELLFVEDGDQVLPVTFTDNEGFINFLRKRK